MRVGGPRHTIHFPTPGYAAYIAKALTFLDYRTPFQALKARLPHVDDRIRLVVPILLDSVAVALGPWSGYNVLAERQIFS